MIDTNELRRLAQAATPGPWHATKSVETNSWAVWSDTTRLMELRPTKTVDMYRVSNTAAFIAAANPAAVSELLDRLEAAEKERDECNSRRLEAADHFAAQMALMKEKCDALRAKIEGVEDERMIDEQRIADLKADLNRVGHENDTLRAKIEQMERQEPVAFALYSGWSFKAAYRKEHEACDQRDRRQLSADLGGSLEAYRVVPLYALPGAQGE